MNRHIEDSIRDKITSVNEYGYKFKNLDAKLDEEEIEYLETEYGLEKNFTYSNGSSVPLKQNCFICKATHLFKYKDHPDSNSNSGFDIRCNGIPSMLPPGMGQQIKEYATTSNTDLARATKIFKSTIDPVTWFELMFNFKDGSKKFLREYQKDELRCTAKRRALRWGRRTGKTFTACAWMLHSVFNEFVLDGYDDKGEERLRGPTILVITPFQAQLTNVFNQIEEILKGNVDLRNQVTTGTNGGLYVQSPFFRMEFSNGAKIYGFVTGVEIKTDGSAGGSVRGQNADKVYVDEMDMIPEDIINKVVRPILFTNENTEFLVSSTPIGKAGMFLQFCKNSPKYRESYYPSTCLPFWEQVKEELETTDPEDDAFKSEYMAEFVESATGVFKTLYIYGAMREYSYADSEPDNGSWWRQTAKVPNRSDLVTVIGIDWNKNAGSEFVVVCYHPPSNQWWVAETINVSAGTHSSMKFKEEVKRLNFKWKPRYIYADEGYGHHIIEDLQYESQQVLLAKPKSGLELEISHLASRLKSFNFSQRVEFKNPIDGTTIVRTGKEFLVENAVRVFESENLRFSASDNVLRKQLLNYVVLRRHPSNNRPVYGMKTANVGDHRLDALMLALGGIFLELNPLYSKNFWGGRTAVKQMIRTEGQDDRPPGGLSMVSRNAMPTRGSERTSRSTEYDKVNEYGIIAGGKSSPYDTLMRAIKERKYPSSDPEIPPTPASKVNIIHNRRPRRRAPWQ